MTHMSEHQHPITRILRDTRCAPGELPLPEKVMLLLHPLAEKKMMVNHSILFREGEHAEYAYLLYSGIVRFSASSLDGRTLTVRLATSGEVLGLSSAFSDRPHHTSAECLTDVCVGAVRKEDLLAFLARDTAARLPVLQLLSEEVNVYRDLIRSFVHAA
jgi:CRP-like cAMP-binding protein